MNKLSSCALELPLFIKIIHKLSNQKWEHITRRSCEIFSIICLFVKWYFDNKSSYTLLEEFCRVDSLWPDKNLGLIWLRILDCGGNGNTFWMAMLFSLWKRRETFVNRKWSQKQSNLSCSCIIFKWEETRKLLL